MRISRLRTGRAVRCAAGALGALLLGATLPAALAGSGAAAVGPEGALQARIEAAPAGGVVVVRGVEQGGVVIRKPLHLMGEPGAVLDGGGRGTVLRIEAPGVVISGLVLRNSGTDLNTEDAGVYIGAPDAILQDLSLENVLFGLNLKRADGATIRRVMLGGPDLPLSRRGDAVRLWYSHRVTLSEVRSRRLRDILIWFSQSSTLHALDVAGSRYGIHLMYADDVRVLNSTFADNAVGAYVMYSTGVRIEGNRFLRHRESTGVGLAFKESDAVLVTGNLLVRNHVGLYLDGTPRLEDSQSAVRGNIIAGNDTGLVLLGSATRNVIAGNRFEGNARQVRVEGGGEAANIWTSGGRGNYWGDYVGLDADRDGVGDVPYRAREWFEGLEDRLPAAALFWGSAAVEAVDFAARLLPIFPPRILVEDPAPLIWTPVPPEHRGSTRSAAFAAVSGLLAAAGLVGLRGRRTQNRWKGAAA